MRRLYRRSPVRHLLKITMAHRGLSGDDIFCAAYPRSGSMYMRWLIVEMLTGEASFANVRQTFPYVGQHRASPRVLGGTGRLIKTHERFMPIYGRVIHLVRDPRDVAISYFHFLQRTGRIELRAGDDVEASFGRYLDALIAGRIDGHGTWQEHLTSWLAASDLGRADVLRVRYEDLRADPQVWLMRIADWMGHELDAERAEQVIERCSLERMRAEEDAMGSQGIFRERDVRSGHRAVREGRVGAWRQLLTDEHLARFTPFADGLARLGYAEAHN